MIQEIEAQKAVLDLMIAGKLTTAEMIPMPKKDNKWKKRANEIGIENARVLEQAYECSEELDAGINEIDNKEE